MEFNRQNIHSKATSAETHVIDEGLRAYMLKVYNYMSSGIFLTGIISLLLFKLSVVMASDGSITGLTSVGNALYNSALMWIVMLAPLAVVFYMSFGIKKMSAAKAQGTFWVFAALMGASLSSIFLVYTGTSITRVFFYYRWNVWCNEHLWIYDKKRSYEIRFFSHDGLNRNHNCINSKYVYEIYNDVLCYIYPWSFNICWINCLRYSKNKKYVSGK